VALSQRLDLPLAGIDLRRTPDGRHVCFEVNPSPAFSFYEQHAGIPIASCIARYLAGETELTGVVY
jgi:glutathione synthase/RimK-type ligase-like ATP-grasp enzyme